MIDKDKSIKECVKQIHNGASIAIGSQTPMAIIREIVRQRKKELVLYALMGGVEIDMLCGAGAVDEVRAFYTILPTGAWAPNFKRAAEAGGVFVREETEASLLLGIKAGAFNLPFVAIQNPHSDIVKLHPEWKLFNSPINGKELLAIPPIIPDVALLHMPRGDKNGNIQGEDKIVYNQIFAAWDRLISQASKKVIVSVEEIVESQTLRENPERTAIPFYDVDFITQTVKGAHPCQLLGHYEMDMSHFQVYAEASKKEGLFREYLDHYVYGTTDNESYLAILDDIVEK